ncbi:MAG: hypothetical protein V7L19_07335 [Nostoc sp.]
MLLQILLQSILCASAIALSASHFPSTLKIDSIYSFHGFEAHLT